jgi:hypothetical protein
MSTRLAAQENEFDKPKLPRVRADAQVAPTRHGGFGLLVGMQILAGCTSDGGERGKAISEVEAHCGLPGGTLSQIYTRRQEQLSKTSPKQIYKEAGHKLIYFGIILTGPIREKHDCITSFESSSGYRFNFHVKNSF